MSTARCEPLDKICEPIIHCEPLRPTRIKWLVIGLVIGILGTLGVQYALEMFRG